MSKQNQPHEASICGAKTSKGTPCQHEAGWGTNHQGKGRCKLHGGASTGPKNQEGNQNAKKHGLFSKYIPKETQEILDGLEERDTLDILWDNIKLQYANIIRSQKIMYVKNQEDHHKEIVGEGAKGITFDYQTAWDRQERYMNALSRAMTTLSGMIEKYEKLCQSEQTTEEQKLRIDKLKIEIDLLKTNQHDPSNTEGIESFLDAIGGNVDAEELFDE